MNWLELLGGLAFVLTAYALGFTRGYARGAREQESDAS